jgi:hypothetical protein
MDPFAPINGISLEMYAELGAAVSDCTNDPERQAQIVASMGVNRADWEAAKAGWTARMQDMSLMGRVAMAYMPMYQAALARRSPVPLISFDEFVALSGAAKAMTVDGMCAVYGITSSQWTQIAGAWTSEIGRNPMQYGSYGLLVEQEGQRVRMTGQPRPAPSLQRQAQQPAAPPVPQPPAPAPFPPQGPYAQQPGQQPVQHPMPVAAPAYAPQPAVPAPFAPPAPYAQQSVPQAAPYAQQPVPPQAPYAQQPVPQPAAYAPQPVPQPAAYAPQPVPQPAPPAQAPQPIAPAGPPQPPSATPAAACAPVRLAEGSMVQVRWADGNAYPGIVMQAGPGQVMVAFSDGRHEWIPDAYVEPR